MRNICVQPGYNLWESFVQIGGVLNNTENSVHSAVDSSFVVPVLYSTKESVVQTISTGKKLKITDITSYLYSLSTKLITSTIIVYLKIINNRRT